MSSVLPIRKGSCMVDSNGFVEQDLSDEWIKMIGFRNALVHDYVDVDREVVFRVLQTKLPVFAAIKRAMCEWL